MNRKSFSSFIAALGAVATTLAAAEAGAVTAPYSEDFESETTCSTSCTASCALSSGWTNDAADGQDWLVDVGGTVSSGTGPSADNTLGTSAGKYLYIESSSPCSSTTNTANLISPDLDLNGLSAPAASFFYHLLGVDIGELHVDVLDTSNALIQADVIPAIVGEVGSEWVESASVDLTPYIASGTVRLRIRYIHSGTGFYGDAAIDDFSFIDAGSLDVGVRSVNLPAVGCGMGMESVTVTLENFSGVPQSGFDVQYSIDGGPPVTETYTGTLGAFSTDLFTFATPADLSAAGQINVEATTLLSGDAATGNDTASLDVWNGSKVVAPVLDDFESPEALSAWSVSGINPSWALGSPSDSTINRAFSGSNAWVTNLTSNYNTNEESYLSTTCGYDLSAIGSPAVRLAIWREIDDGSTSDGAVLQSSIDGGSSWQTVGGFDSGVNWYNDDANEAAPGGSAAAWTGDETAGSGDWLVAIHDLSHLAGQSDVLFRVAFESGSSLTDEGIGIDDFEVFDNLPEVVVTSIAGEAPPVLGAIPAGSPVLVGAAEIAALGPAVHNLTTLSVTNVGNVGDNYISWQLYLDDGDGAFDASLDALLETALQTSGAADFDTAALSVAPFSSEIVFVTAEVLDGATPGDTFGWSIDAPSIDLVFDTSPTVTVTNPPVQGYTYPVGERVASLPFFDDFDDVSSALREIVGPGAFPAAVAAGDTPALGTVYTNEGRVELLSSHDGLTPREGANMLAIDFPNSTSAGAVQYAFDLSSLSAASDELFFFIRYADDGEEVDDEDGVFVSLDGGATWALKLIDFAWTAPVNTWVEETVDLSAALTAAGLDYSGNVVIRVQAQDNSSLASGDGFLLDAVGLGSLPKAELSRPVGNVFADGDSDPLGSMGTSPVTLSYQVSNVGGFPLRLDAANLTGVSGFSAIKIGMPSNRSIAAGTSEIIDVEITPSGGPFGFELLVSTNDSSLGDGVFNIVASGDAVPPAPEIALLRDDTSAIASGGSDDLGSVELGQSAEQSYTIVNEGTADLLLAGVVVDDPSNAMVAIEGQLPPSIAPGDSVSFSVRLTPEAAGSFGTTLSIASDDADENPYVITLSGQADDPTAGAGGAGAGGNDGGDNGGDVDPEESDDASAGGGCQITSGTSGGDHGWLALVALALGVAFRRRVRGAGATLKAWRGSRGASRAARSAVSMLATVVLLAIVAEGCAEGTPEPTLEDDAGSAAGGNDGSGGGTTAGGGDDLAGGAGGQGGDVAAGGNIGENIGDPSLCDQDCSLIDTGDQCTKAVCNDGTLLGPVGVCTVVYADGDVCDDGQFCTMGETCSQGVCGGGQPNTCGIQADQCQDVTCDEGSQSCSTIAAANGDPCQSDDLCMVGATCQNGACEGGTPNECLFTPTSDDCHVAVCNPQSGMCEEQVGNEGGLCNDPSDLCTENKTCNQGTCEGGTAKDCSAQTAGCDLGVCDTTTGDCTTQTLMSGDTCDDLDACTMGEMCMADGSCSGGTPVTNCEMAGDGCCPSNCDANNDYDCGCPGTWINGTCVYLPAKDQQYSSATAAQAQCQGLGTGWDLCSPSMLCDAQTASYLGTEGCDCSGGASACSCGSASNVYVHVSGGSSPYYLRDSGIANCGSGACTASVSETCGVALCCKQ